MKSRRIDAVRRKVVVQLADNDVCLISDQHVQIGVTGSVFGEEFYPREAYVCLFTVSVPN